MEVGMPALRCCRSIVGLDAIQEHQQVLLLQQELQELWSSGGVSCAAEDVESALVSPVFAGA